MVTHDDIAAAHYRALQRCGKPIPRRLTQLYPQYKPLRKRRGDRLSDATVSINREVETRAKYRAIVEALIENKLTQREIARRFGLSESAVGKVRKGILGKRHTADLLPLLPQVHTLSADDVKAIYKLAWNGTSQAEIATRYGLPQPAISDIKHGRTWRRVTSGLQCAP